MKNERKRKKKTYLVLVGLKITDVCLKLPPSKMTVHRVTPRTAHRCSTLDTIPRAMHVQLVLIQSQPL